MTASQTIPSLHKSIGVLQSIADGLSPATVKAISSTLRIPPATCYRIVRTFLEHNWLREDPQEGYRIGFGLARLARSYAGVKHALSQMEHPLRELAVFTGLSAKITLCEGHQAITALRAEPPNPHAITSPIGSGFSLVIGSAAAVLLAGFSDKEISRVIENAEESCWVRQTPEDVWRRVREVRDKGLCCELGQYHSSIFAVSIPLQLTREDRGALTLVGWPDQFAAPRLQAIEKRLKSAARRFHSILERKEK